MGVCKIPLTLIMCLSVCPFPPSFLIVGKALRAMSLSLVANELVINGK